MIERVFKHFDAYQDAIKHARVRITLRRRERPRWVVGGLKIGRLHLQWGASGGSNLAEGEIKPGGYALFVPLNRCTVDVVNGQRMNQGSVMAGSPGSDFCISADSWNDWFSLFIPLDVADDSPTDGNRPRRCGLVSIDHRQVRAIRGVVRALTKNTVVDAKCWRAAVRAAEAPLLAFAERSIHTSWQAGELKRGRPVVDRWEVLQSVMKDQLLGADQTRRLHNSVPRALVSQRTLRRAFHEWLCVSPARYARLRQLHRAREALLAANPATDTVTAVLTECGVLELGRFAGAYASLFGEHPSQTLESCDHESETNVNRGRLCK